MEQVQSEPDSGRVLRFLEFTYDRLTEQLTRDGQPVPLPPTPTRLLAFLLERAGRLVTRDEIRRGVWGERHVEFDQALNFAMRQLRRALNEPAHHPRLVQVVPRRGYIWTLVPSIDEPSDRPAREAPPAPVRTRSPLWPWGATLAGLTLAAVAGAWLAAGRGDRPAGVLVTVTAQGAVAPDLVERLDAVLTGELSAVPLGARTATPPVVRAEVRPEPDGAVRLALRLHADPAAAPIASISATAEAHQMAALARDIAGDLRRRLTQGPLDGHAPVTVTVER